MPKKVDHTKEQTLAQQAKEAQQVKKEKVAAVLEGTEAGEIWNEIKDLNIEMFALPGQKVDMHCTPVPADPTKLFLLTNSSAVLPSLEAAVNKDAKGNFQNRFVVELADRFVTVTRASVSLTDKYGIK